MNRRERRASRHGYTHTGQSLLDQMGMTIEEFERSAEELVTMGLCTKKQDPDGRWRYFAVEGIEVQEVPEDELPSSVVPFHRPK